MAERPTDEQRYAKVLEYFRAPFPICPRCANGVPVCADFDKRGYMAEKWISHPDPPFEVLGCGCPNYTWADDVCAKCEKEMEAEEMADD